MERDPLEYVMNRMEIAAQSGDPAGNGYGPARRELIEGIRALRDEVSALQGQLDPEERAIREIILSARKIQNFLWGGINTGAGFEEFRRMLRKRLVKMDEISFENPYWKTEARKRLLQVAAVAVQCIGRLEDPGFQGSNLHEYTNPVREQQP